MRHARATLVAALSVALCGCTATTPAPSPTPGDHSEFQREIAALGTEQVTTVSRGKHWAVTGRVNGGLQTAYASGQVESDASAELDVGGSVAPSEVDLGQIDTWWLTRGKACIANDGGLSVHYTPTGAVFSTLYCGYSGLQGSWVGDQEVKLPDTFTRETLASILQDTEVVVGPELTHLRIDLTKGVPDYVSAQTRLADPKYTSELQFKLSRRTTSSVTWASLDRGTPFRLSPDRLWNSLEHLSKKHGFPISDIQTIQIESGTHPISIRVEANFIFYDLRIPG